MENFFLYSTEQYEFDDALRLVFNEINIPYYHPYKVIGPTKVVQLWGTYIRSLELYKKIIMDGIKHYISYELDSDIDRWHDTIVGRLTQPLRVDYSDEKATAIYKWTVGMAAYYLDRFLDLLAPKLRKRNGFYISQFIRKVYFSDQYHFPLNDVNLAAASILLLRMNKEEAVGTSASDESWMFLDSYQDYMEIQNTFRRACKSQGLSMYSYFHSGLFANQKRVVTLELQAKKESNHISYNGECKKRNKGKEKTCFLISSVQSIGGERNPSEKAKPNDSKFYDVFYHDEVVEEVYMHNDVKEIRNHAFEGCTNLRNIHLSSRLELIGPEAFKDCISLETIHIPDTVTSIHPTAFQGCYNLKEVTFEGSEDEWKKIMFISDPECFRDCSKEFHIKYFISK